METKKPTPNTLTNGHAIDTVIFDIGNVLSRGNHHRVQELEETISETGQSIVYGPQEFAAWQDYKLGRCTEAQYWQRTLANTPLQGREAEIAEHVRTHFANAEAETPHRLLAPLKEAGYRLAVLSNHSNEWAGAIIDSLDLKRYCDPIIISAAVGLAKPDPSIWDYTLRAVGRKSAPYKVAFIDDRDDNIETAQQAGSYGILFTPGSTDVEAELKRLGIRL